MSCWEKITEKMIKDGHRFYAADNVSKYIEPHEKEILIDECTRAFEFVLDSLLVDRKNDPNSQGTARRLAKMYYNEIFAGRYTPTPNATAFPNTGDDKYDGMLVVRAELRSICSHHHQPVKGVAYIAIIPNEKLIGLSKYVRLAQHLARRGTLQEELCNRIVNSIREATGSDDVAVYISATHGCMKNRGINATSSLTQTTRLSGQFHDPDVKKEFFDNIALQQSYGEK